MTTEMRYFVVQTNEGLFLTDLYGEFLSPKMENAKQYRNESDLKRALLKLGPNWKDKYKVKELLVLYTIGEWE